MLPEPLAGHPRHRELALLVSCARAGPRLADPEVLATVTAPDLDWEYLQRLAHVHGLLPLLHRHVAAAPPVSVPDAAAASLRERSLASARRGLLLAAAMGEAVRLLEARGIDAVPFKGPLLADALYGDVGLRPFRDVDVLVRERDLLAAIAALEDAGFALAPPLRPGQRFARLHSAWVSDVTLARGAAQVELHWQLTQPYFGVADTLDTLAGELVPAEIAGVPVRTLSPTVLAFYLIVHGATHRWERLEWLADVAALLHGRLAVDWDGLERHAEVKGARRMVGLALRLAGDLLGAPPPPGRLASWAEGGAVARLAREVYAALPAADPDPNPGLKLAPFHLAMRERLRDRLRYGAAVLLAPSPLDIQAVPLPAALFPLYFAARPFRLAVLHGRALLPRRRAAAPQA